MKFTQQFIQQGYCYSILRQDDLGEFVESMELKSFQQNILLFRKKMRKFFERPDSERLLLKSEQPKDLRDSGYYAGYWSKGLFKDEYEDKTFPLEYYHSRNFYSSQRDNFFMPKNVLEQSGKDQAAELPHEQGYEIARFLERHIFKPLALELSAKLQFDLQPFSTLQVAPTFYRNRIALNMHRDKAFLQVIIGPASGLKIKPKNSNTTQLIDLELGEILVYTGFQFQEYFAEVPALDDIEPLLHGVVVNEDKRMSIIGGTLLKI